MNELSQWGNPIFQQTIAIVLGILFVAAIPVYLFRNKGFYFPTAWASIKSWLFAAPLLLLALGSAKPWPTITLTIISILGIKVFFQLMGMYHRIWFLWCSYLGLFCLAWLSYHNQIYYYNLAPMIFLSIICFIPIVTNSYKNMTQYISLSLIAFMFFGWALLHTSLILHLKNGIYQLLYLIILTEFFDNTNLATAKYFPKAQKFKNIFTRRTLGSSLLSAFLTLVLAYAMRHLLPVSSDIFWLTAGIIASIGGMWGNIVISILKKDLDIKIDGLFVLGRGDFLSRVDRLIFVAPLYFYTMSYLSRMM